jgi:hypothetical protein
MTDNTTLRIHRTYQAPVVRQEFSPAAASHLLGANSRFAAGRDSLEHFTVTASPWPTERLVPAQRDTSSGRRARVRPADATGPALLAPRYF